MLYDLISPDIFLFVIWSKQALSNGVYKSIKHRVRANEKVERFSVAFFFCPTMDTVIQSCSTTEPAVFKSFTFQEYKEQMQRDVHELGDKVGLSRFFLWGNLFFWVLNLITKPASMFASVSILAYTWAGYISFTWLWHLSFDFNKLFHFGLSLILTRALML